MLKVVSKSSNAKLGKIAATYRSGNNDMYGTCPSTCPLKPSTGSQGSDRVNAEYLAALIDAVPEEGVSWTYSHFDRAQLPKPQIGKTCINVSEDTIEEAIASIKSGYPTVVAVPAGRNEKVEKIDGVRFVRCPAEYRDETTCANCGGLEPLCARPFRDFVIKFTAHGTQAKKVGKAELGGCYGSSGPVAIHWKKTSTAEQFVSDAQKLTEWVKTLPKDAMIRHHVVGDVG